MEFEVKAKQIRTQQSTVSTDAEDGGKNLYVFEELPVLAKILSQKIHK